MKGKVKWFSDKLGYGFIESDSKEKDIFVHFKEINIEGYKTLYAGDIVEFDYDKEKNKATNLNIIKRTDIINTMDL